MTLARTAALALLLLACGAPAAVALHTGAPDSALAEASHTGVTDGAPAEPGPIQFAPPRPLARAADPLRPSTVGGVAVRLDASLPSIAEGPGVLWGRAPAGVQAELEYNAGHLQRCWEARANKARSGAIVIHAHLDASGLVGEQCVTEDAVGDPELLRCANDLVAMGRYSALEDGSDAVVFTFQFDGGEGSSTGRAGTRGGSI